MVGVYIDGGDERGGGVSLVMLSPNIARTRPRSNAYFPRWTVECFGENRPNRKAFSTSFSEMNLQSILHAPWCVSSSGFDVNFERILDSWSFLSFSFWIWTLARKAAAHDARTMETYREASKDPRTPFFAVLQPAPRTFLANVFFFFCRAVVVAVVVR